MGNIQQPIQEKQLSEIELPFQFHSIPKKILHTNQNQGSPCKYLVVSFQQSQSFQNHSDSLNISLEELLHTITIRKMRNYFQCVSIRNIADYKAENNPQTSIQSDFQALILLLYFLSMNDQLDSLNIRWISPLPFFEFNEIMNLIASFQNLKSLVLNMRCNQINNPDDQVFLQPFSSRISCQHNLTRLDLILNFEECNINRLQFNSFLADLSNLRFLQTITLRIQSKVYSNISIDSLIVLPLHPSLKSISIHSNKIYADDNSRAFMNKNISETYLNQLTSSSLQSIYLNQFDIYDLNILFSILTRLPFLMNFSIVSKYRTSNTDSQRFKIIPYQRDRSFPVLESIKIMIFSTLNVQFYQELLNGLSQFKAYEVQVILQSLQGVTTSDLSLEKTLIAISQGEIINLEQRDSNFQGIIFFDNKIIKNSDLLNEFISSRKSVCLAILAFKRTLWSFMKNNPLHVILDLYMD